MEHGHVSRCHFNQDPAMQLGFVNMCVSILPMICEWVQRGHQDLNDDDDDVVPAEIGGHGEET